MDKTIKVWYWADAPEEFRKLANPDDVDYVAFVPHGVELPMFMAEGSGFGCCTVEEFVTQSGIVYVGHHS